MNIKRLKNELFDSSLNAYSMLAFSISVLVMLAFGYENADPMVITVCLVLALAAFGEFMYIMLRRDKALKIVAKRRMQSIQRRRLKRAQDVMTKPSIKQS